MATFKVGQRVRVIAVRCDTFVRVGMTGTVTECGAIKAGIYGDWIADYMVDLDQAPGVDWCFGQEHLAPLTDPLADAFIERIKKLAREPQPVRETECPAQGGSQ